MGGAKPKKKSKPAAKASAGGYNATPEEIKPHRKLYVGNLTGMDMTEAKLTELFKACGAITSLELVITNNAAFAFVEFSSIPEAESCIEKMNGHEGMVVKFGKPQLLAAAVVATAPAERGAAEKSDDEEEEQEEAAGNDNSFEQDCAVAAARKYANPVESLQAIVQKAIRTTSTAECVIYTVKEVEDEWETLFIGTVELKVPAGSISHSGKPQENKKEAKKAAAEAALHDVSTHRLLPVLPAKVKEEKVEKPADSDEEDGGDAPAKAADAREVWKPGCTNVQPTKKQQQLEKAAKAAKRKAGKAAKAAAAETQVEEEQDISEEEADEESSASEETDHSDEESEEESSEDDSSDDEEADEAEKARKEAIKAALASRRKAAPKKARTAAGVSREKGAISSAQKLADKAAREAARVGNEVLGTLKQENFGATKFIKP